MQGYIYIYIYIYILVSLKHYLFGILHYLNKELNIEHLLSSFIYFKLGIFNFSDKFLKILNIYRFC